MIDSTPKVALLGRPGPAREHLRKALSDLGGEITIEGEPGDLSPSQVSATAPTVVVVSLDAAMEDQLDDWDELFDAEGLNVIFDEAETTSQLDGWDLARWARHLAAKILGHDQTLPPPPEGSAAVQGAVDWIPSPGGPMTPAAQMDAERLEDYAVEALDHAGGVPVADDPGTGEDRVDADADANANALARGDIDAGDGPSWTSDMTAIEAEELELDDDLAALIAQHDANAAQDGVVRFDTFQDTSVDVEVATLESDFEFTIEFQDAAGAEGQEPENSGAAVDGGEMDDASGTDAFELGEVNESADDTNSPATMTAAEAQRFSFGRELELVLEDEDADSEIAVQVAPTPPPRPAGAMSFDQLAAAFQLEDDDSDEAEDEDGDAGSAPGPAGARGVVVLLAGMGGPDALRQLLSALPPRIPVPVVVWQQLNAGTHDRLASQLAKTGKVETELAKAGEPLKAGRVYILPPGIGIGFGEVLAFNEDSGSPAGMLKALEPLGDDAVVVALSGAESAWLADSAQWAAKGGRLLAQSPATCFEASACDVLVRQGVADASPADLAIRALGKWHEDN